MSWLVLSTTLASGCEGVFGADFDGLQPQPTDPIVVDGGGVACASCPAVEHGVTICEPAGCAVTCDAAYRRCQQGCCAVAEAPVAAGETHSCATASSGALYCWGENGAGQLGDRSREDRLRSTLAFGVEGGVRQIAIGADFTLVAMTSGLVLGWGANTFGALGDGTRVAREAPAPIDALHDVAFLSASGRHACAVSRAGRASCWGFNVSGVIREQLDDPVVDRPVAVSQPEPFAALDTGAAHTCAAGVSDAFYCWGDNSRGQLGLASDVTRAAGPTAVPMPGAQVTAVASGRMHTCVLDRAGGVRCFGGNEFGQLGSGDTLPREGGVQTVPESVIVTQVDVGEDYACAVTAAGALQCWGTLVRQGAGRPVPPEALRPVVKDLGGPVTSVAVGAQHACARMLTGAVRCWGRNAAGQLGDGSRNDSLEGVSALLPP